MPRAKQPVNLRDIARSAGVAVPTVSRILNEKTEGFSVRPDVRERVLAAAQQLNYKPNVLAQSLRKERMNIVGLLSFQPELQYYKDIVAGLVNELSDKRIELCGSYAAGPHPIQRLPSWRTDGAAVVSALSLDELAPVEAAGIPYVSINGVVGAHGMSIGLDDVSGARKAIEYLLRLGHRRIAYANANGPWITHSSVALRHKAYLDALSAAGLEPMPMHDQSMPEHPVEMCRAWVFDHRATAIVCYHNFHAVDVHSTLAKLGIRVPQDVSLLSLHDAYPLQFLHPAVTGVEMERQFYEMGKIAGRMLIDTFAGKPVARRHVLVEETLVIRDSTAAPPRQPLAAL